MTELEPITMMEPLAVRDDVPAVKDLNDAVFSLIGESSALSNELPLALAKPLARLIRAMNCYYSNLIEGHDTHPISIERAMKRDFSADIKKRNLQLEARAHVCVQEWIDDNPPENPFAPSFIREIHRRFYEELPEEIRFVDDKETGERIPIIPGEYRDRHVAVGNHFPVSAAAIPSFMERYHRFYSGLDKINATKAMGAAHHRLVWIHPFLDGNGRVSRLASHAFANKVLKSQSLWSIARGLARNVDIYKAKLANADLPRRNSLDGRGNLSEETLLDFSVFYIEACRDQIAFMRRLMSPETLRKRIAVWANDAVTETGLSPHAPAILDRLVTDGRVLPSAIAEMRDVSGRTARRIIVDLIEADLVRQDEEGGPIVLNFPAAYAHAWMPNLFPETETPESTATVSMGLRM